MSAHTTMRVAAGQFIGSSDWRLNVETCTGLIAEAASRGAELLVLPEASFRTRPDGDKAPTDAQPIDGPFVSALAAATITSSITVVVGTVEPAPDGRVYNTLAVLRDGELRATYRKFHLYDAFSARESDRVAPGDGPLVVIDCGAFRVGLMTCYDVRFPEMARLLADRGADVIVVPTSWVSGPLKEHHWKLMTAARALENTCYVVAAGKCGPSRIGLSRIIDPTGITIAQLGSEPGLLDAVLDRKHLGSVRQRLPLLQQRRFRVDPNPLAPLDISQQEQPQSLYLDIPNDRTSGVNA